MMRRPAAAAALLLLCSAVVPALSSAALAADGAPPAPAPPPIQVRVQLDPDGAGIDRLTRLGLDVDGVFDGWARVYVTAEELAKLQKLGFSTTVVRDDMPAKAEEARRLAAARAELAPDPDAPRAIRGTIPASYHTYTTLTADLQQIAADHPDIVRLVSIGQTVQGRELWMVKLTDQPDVEENEPEFSYISSMHGDEVVGKEMLYHLLDYMTDGYGTDPRVTNLIDSTEIWIMPSMNPDGTELGTRWNANGTDLNRDFPDQFVDPVNTPAGREPETAAVMNWKADRTIDLSSNFHGGALVANYPWDSNPQGTSTFSPTPVPDHPLFVSLARTYADNNVPMSQQNGGSFQNGITNGADWYAINGGMQDWSFIWYGGHEVLMELSLSKWPSASTLPGYWDDNLESMLAYMERVHEGVRGVVTDIDTGLPVRATVQVDASPWVDYADPDLGDYHRLLPAGTYTLTVTAPSYETKVIPNVVVATGAPATVVDVQLGPEPVNLQPAAERLIGEEALDPGDVADLAVTLQNLGRGATGVSATLMPTGWNATVTRADATYPDIPLGASAESDAPHFEVAVDPATPSGRKLGFALAWQSDQGAAMSAPFFLELGEAAQQLSNATDVPKTISAFAGAIAVSEMTISPAEGISNITDIKVSVNIPHTYIGDLTIELTSPEGTTVVLHANTGGSADDIVGTYGVDLTPAQPLSAFFGEDSTGTWTLTVTDDYFNDGGSIEAWSLDIQGRPADTSTPELRFRSFDSADGKVQATWWEYPGLTSYRVYRATDPSLAANFLDITASDPNPSDTFFEDAGEEPVVYYLVTGVGPNGEGPKGHFGE